jgi:hypothetical protein
MLSFHYVMTKHLVCFWAYPQHPSMQSDTSYAFIVQMKGFENTKLVGHLWPTLQKMMFILSVSELYCYQYFILSFLMINRQVEIFDVL